MSNSEDRQKALEAALAQINKTNGEGTVMRLGDKANVKIPSFSSGSLSLDLALGIGGFPRGRIIEIYGPEASGKTLLTLSAIAQVQKTGGVAAFIDAEHALDPNWAAKIGVNIDELIVTQPDNGEAALEIAEKLVSSGAVDLIVIDSVAALTPRKEIEGEMGDSMVGVQARLMSQALRKLTIPASKTGTTIIFINQLREKIGVMFGSPETTTGGKALKFYASVRLDVRRKGQIKSGDQVVGAETRVKVVKNKVAPPFKEALYNISFLPGTEGISLESEIIELGVEEGIVKKSGAWYTYGNEQLGQGKEKASANLRENIELRDDLQRQILVARGVLEDPNAESADEADFGGSDADEA